jgi:hypothetical protein
MQVSARVPSAWPSGGFTVHPLTKALPISTQVWHHDETNLQHAELPPLLVSHSGRELSDATLFVGGNQCSTRRQDG